MSAPVLAVMALGLALSVVAVVLGSVVRRQERRRRALRRRIRRLEAELADHVGRVTSRLPSISLAELDPRFAPKYPGSGPGEAAAVHFIGRADLDVPGALTDTEVWVLAALAKECRRIFEFGTGSGRTAWALARNSPEDARVTTLTLPPDAARLYHAAPGDEDSARVDALLEAYSGPFFYEGTEVAGKIEQLFGDSKAFDEKPWEGCCDLVFIDGSHARSYVENDSDKALRMVRPGGLVVWHDLRPPAFQETRGVYQHLNRLARERPLVHVRGTRFAVLRA